MFTKLLSKKGLLTFSLNRVINNEKLHDRWEAWVADQSNFASDEEERQVADYLIDEGLATFKRVIDTGDVSEFLASRRTAGVVFLRFIADNIEEYMGNGVDIPKVPEWLERLGAQTVRTIVVAVLIPWCEKAPPLND